MFFLYDYLTNGTKLRTMFVNSSANIHGRPLNCDIEETETGRIESYFNSEEDKVLKIVIEDGNVTFYTNDEESF